MNHDGDNVIDLEAHRRERKQDTPHSRRAEAEKARWLEIWTTAWQREEARRGKVLSLSERADFAYHVRALVEAIRDRCGARSGKVAAALEKAALCAADPDKLVERDCPRGLIERSLKMPEYRIDRFTSENPKELRGKLADWLWVVEALAGELGRDQRREVIQFIDEPRRTAAAESGASTQLAESYDAVFADLSARLADIVAIVARKYEVASYYECCDKMHAAWVDGEIVEDDGWAHRFNRYEFQDAGWVDLRDGSYWDDPAARSPLGPIGEVLIHAPLARVSFCFVDYAETELKEADLPGEWASLELDIHLAIRPDVEDPRQSGAVLIHPFVAVYDNEIQHASEVKSARWWSSWPQVALEHVDERWVALLNEAVPAPIDQHMERGKAVTRAHLGEARLIPLTGEACQTWLSFGANSLAPDFGEYFWYDPAAAQLDPVGIVSAPAGTLAGFIQYNLLMAAETGNLEGRIDQVLARDAARKVASVKLGLEKKRLEFQRRISELSFEEAERLSDKRT